MHITNILLVNNDIFLYRTYSFIRCEICIEAVTLTPMYDLNVHHQSQK